METHEVKDTFATLSAFEAELGLLYKLFAARFPAGQALWAQLAMEENGHAAQVRRLSDKVCAGELTIDPGRLNHELYAKTLAHVRELTAHFQQPDVTFPQALTATHVIESALLDKQFFGIFDSDAEPLRRVFTILQNESQAHAARVTELLRHFK